MISRFTTILAIVIFLSFILLGGMQTFWTYDRFSQELTEFKKEVTLKQHQTLRLEVERTIDYLESLRNQVEVLARKKLKERIYRAQSILDNLKKTYDDTLNDEKLQEIFFTTLRPQRFPGKGYYFVSDFNGISRLNPNRLEFEGCSLLDFTNNWGIEQAAANIKIAKEDGEGFLRYFFCKPGETKDKVFPKISFIKQLTPYDMYIGTGVYLDDLESEVQNGIAAYIDKYRFGYNNSGYIFLIKINDLNGGEHFGTMFANANRPDLIGKTISDSVTDAHGKFFRREFLKGLREKGECYVEYWYKRFSRPEPEPKLTFFKHYKEADLIVAAGSYLPDNQLLITQKRKELITKLQHDLLSILIVLTIISLGLLLLARHWTRKSGREFDRFRNFFSRAAMPGAELEKEKFSFSEMQDLARDANLMLEERNKLDKKLKEREELFRTLTETSPTGIFIYQDDIFIYANRSTSTISGYSNAELLDMPLGQLLHPEMQELVKKRELANQYVPADLSGSYQIKMIRKDHQERWLIFSTAPINYQGKSASLGNIVDITQRKFAKEALAKEKEQLAVTLRSIGEGVITTDLSGKILLLNKVAEKLTGWSNDAASARPLEEVFKILNEKNQETCKHLFTTMIDSGQIVEFTNNATLLTKDGQELSIACSGAPIFDASSNITGVILVFRDISEKLRIEQEALKVRKLESVGVLAGGIAHDFNNILAALLGNTSLALTITNPKDEIYELLTESEKACLRAKDLTQQLLTFSKGGDPVKKLAAIDEIIRDSAGFVLRGSNVRCDFRFDEDLWSLEIDTGQISQVIQNIIINASQAMPTGGTIVIECRNQNLKSGITNSVRPGNYIKIVITDQGVGIPTAILDQIFDPYFTTKQKGNGLGLAITHTIISKHNGHISVASEPGKGTVFTIYLPASQNLSEIEQDAIELSPKTATSKILIMDDEEIIRTIVERMLSNNGHEVCTAKDGAETVQRYQEALQEGAPFDLIIMDLTIPGGMGGKEAIKKIHDINPAAKAIVSSGYSNDPIVAHFADYGFRGALVKPFRMQELNTNVNKVLSDP